jgi:chitodextrinase
MKKIIFAVCAMLMAFAPALPSRAADVVPPSVPQNLGYLYTTDNSIALTWSASTDFLDPSNVSYVIYQNGSAAATATTIPFTLTGLLPNTLYSFSVASKDSSNNVSAQSNTIMATTSSDTVPPTVAITFPAANAVLDGIVQLTATSTDDVAVDRVQYLLDGNPLGDPLSNFPYELDFNVGNYQKNSRHTLSALAYDTSDNAGRAPAVNFTIGQALAPAPYSISVGQTTFSSAVISWQTSGNVVGSVKYGLSSAYSTTTKESWPTNQHQLSLTNLASGQTYHFSVQSELSGYVTSSSTDMTFATTAVQAQSNDTLPPTVAITSPAAGSVLQGAAQLQISADDGYSATGQARSGLRAVWITVDGSPLGGEQTFAPFLFFWDTPAYTDGPHTVTVYAQDNVGNTAQIQASYTVNNRSQASLPAGVHPNGTLVSVSGTIYLISGGQKQPFRDGEEYKSYGYKFSQAVPASSGDQALPASSGIVKAMEGTLVLDKADGRTVYMVGLSGTKRGFASQQVFMDLGYKFQNLFQINMSDYPAGSPIISSSETHPDGALVLEGQTVWWIRGGQRQGFESIAVFNTYGFSFSKIVPANAADLSLPKGSLVKFRDGTLVSDSGNYYIISDGKKLKFASLNGLKAKGYDPSNVISASLAGYQDGSAVQ